MATHTITVRVTMDVAEDDGLNYSTNSLTRAIWDLDADTYGPDRVSVVEVLDAAEGVAS